MRHHHAEAGPKRSFNRLKGLAQGADLVDLHQDGVGRLHVDALAQPLGVGDEDIVADQLHPVADGFVEGAPALPVIFGHAVFDGADGVAVAELGEVGHQLVRAVAQPSPAQLIAAVFVELAGGAIERNVELTSRRVARRHHALQHEVDGFLCRLEVGREAALVADVGGMARLFQPRLQAVEDLRTHAQRLREALGADRPDHELLEVDGVVGMGAAVDDVHHRHRQAAGAYAADIAIERQGGLLCRRLGDGQADAKDGVGTQAPLVLRTVEGNHGLVDQALLVGLHAREGIEDLVIDAVDRGHDAFAEVAILVAVAQLHRLMDAGRGAGGHGGATEGAALQGHVDLDRRIAA